MYLDVIGLLCASKEQLTSATMAETAGWPLASLQG